MKRVLTAAVLIPLVLVAVFKAPLWLFALVIAVVAFLTIHEYLAMIAAYGIEPLPWMTYGMVLLVVGGVFASNDPQLLGYFTWSTWLFRCWTVLLLLSMAFGIPVVFRQNLRMALPASAASAFGVLYIAAPLSLLIVMRHDEIQCFLVIFILLASWAGDTAAYYAGRAFGRHKLAPVVSPNKSWEGSIASVVATILAAFVLLHYYPQISSWFSGLKTAYWLSPAHSTATGSVIVPWWQIILLGIITNVATQLGDLFESAIKRGAQVKDSGSLLPGHGGMLDRIDALLFAIPAVWYYANLTGFLEKSVFHR
ncbi:MAG TPA: phosphatidate cytidylyltransferase [Candidatus Angelobacter sp.]|jgi:phosphatidate cytidylyltransferase|nr:phosphatidate cytidylyltransferase [Candidatus Angelobacter sp.]